MDPTKLMEISRQEYWSGLPFPSPGDLPSPGMEPESPALQADALLPDPPGKPDGDSVVIIILFIVLLPMSGKGFPSWHGIKNPSANAGDVRDTGSIPGLGGSPGGGRGNPRQCSCGLGHCSGALGTLDINHSNTFSKSSPGMMEIKQK